MQLKKLDIVTLREKGRVVNVDSLTAKVLMFSDLGPGQNIGFSLLELYKSPQTGDYLINEQGKCGSEQASLCEKVVYVGIIEKIRGHKVVLNHQGRESESFKRRLEMDEIAKDAPLKEGDVIVFRQGSLSVENKDAEEYAFYALATDREDHAVEKRTR